MIPTVGSTCLFTFTAQFGTLDGVYTVRSATTFLSALAAGVDFVDNLFVPAGLARADYNAQYVSFQNDRVVVLESVLDNTVVYYVPESIFASVPDPTVREYIPMAMVVDLGIHRNTQAVLPFQTEVNDLIVTALGLNVQARLIGDPNQKIYITDADYATIEQDRAVLKQNMTPMSAQIYQLEQENQRLTALLAKYEAKLLSLSSPSVP